MNAPKKIPAASAFFYLIALLSMLALHHLGQNGEPFALAVLYAMLASGLNVWTSCLFYILSALGGFTLTLLPVYTGQSAILFLAFCCERKLHKSGAFLTLSSTTLALALFVALSPFHAYTLPLSVNFLLSPLVQKTVIAGVILLLCATFTVAFKAILKKLLRCRLKPEEIVFSALFFVLTGTGFCRVAGLNAYTGVAFFLLLLFAYTVKDASGVICAFVLALPPALAFGVSVGRFFIYGVAVVLFVGAGRLAAALALLCTYLAFGYLDGIYFLSASALVESLLAALLPCLCFLLLPAPFVHSLENKLVFYREKHLSRVAINRNRAAIGEKLFEISGVFREIQTTFHALSSNEAETGAKEYIRSVVVESVCKSCPNRLNCRKKGLETDLDKLIALGCAKGKTSLIDLPTALGEACVNPSGLLYAVNRRIGEYRKYMLETENAATGRQLLAGQAQGVSEILRNIALEQSEPLTSYTEREKRLDIELLRAGIVCSEVLILGDEDEITLSLVTFGRADVRKIAAISSSVLGETLTISERLTLGKDKFCCILRKKPRYDAAFGVATTTKSGERASGDTHAIVKIDERRFMLALSDGMGSGEYARRISESTVSLLESFYRAKMPSPLVLSTINKLLTFSKEESFACVDIGVVDLDSGTADIVKIGSPLAFILSGTTLRILESDSLPLGILESLRPDTATYELNEDDVLLFVSDGITSAFGSTADLYETLKTVPASNPQRLADTLLDRALALYGGEAKDDMTVLAVRLFKNPEAA